MSKKHKKGRVRKAVPRPVTARTRGPLQVQVQGLTLTVDGAAIDDVELFDMLNEFGSNEQMGLMLVPRMIRALFGDQSSQVMDHLRDPDTGRVTFEKASEFLGEAIEALDPNSRRSPSSQQSMAGPSQPTSSGSTEEPLDGS